jgi:hypothetical protein
MTELLPVGYGRPDRLFELLPVVVRQLDAAGGHPLRDLLRVLSEQVARVEDGITTLGEEPFIETCSDWAVPYIGELVGWTPVAEAGLPALGNPSRDLIARTVLVPRRDVANTIRHRRRKGTLALLEELAHDVAGWPAVAVEFYRMLRYAQHVEHAQTQRGRNVDVRHVDDLEFMGGPFERAAHVVDVRRGGLHNVPSVRLFVWRLGAYSNTKAPAAQAEHIDGPHVFTFDSLYHDVPLFVRPTHGGSVHPTSAADAPTPLTRRLLEHRQGPGAPGQPGASPVYYGEERSLMITAHDWPRRGVTTDIRAEDVRPADLSDWRRYRARPGTVAVDPELGRMLFPVRGAPSSVTVTYHYGFPADLGGGEYDRKIPELPARAIVRFTTDQISDPATVILAVRDDGDDAAKVIRGHWPVSGAARLASFDPAQPPGDELLDDLVVTLDTAAGDPAFHLAAAPNLMPPRGDALLLANRRLIEERFSGLIATALFAESAASGEELAAKLQLWQSIRPRYGVIDLTRTHIYDCRVSLALTEGQQLVIRAANRQRPIVWLPDRRPDRADSLAATLETSSRLVLDGLTLAGRAVRLTGIPPTQADREVSCAPSRVTIRHCTLVPGRIPSYDRDPEPPPPALELADLGGAVVEISHSVVGAISVGSAPPWVPGEGGPEDRHLHPDPVRLRVADSIVDATRPEHEAIGRPGEGVPSVALTLVRSTVRGTVRVRSVDLVENAILSGQVDVVRRRSGCVRYSWVEPGSCTPQRFRCQPDLAVAALGDAPSPDAVEREQASTRPRFTTTEYGGSGYFQLVRDVAEGIRRGADDDSEMGVYHDLYQPQRQANLTARLQEYTPAGMQSGLVILT